MVNKNIVSIVSELIDRYTEEYNKGTICWALPGNLSLGDLHDFMTSSFYSRLDTMISKRNTNNDEYRYHVLEKTFEILDNAGLINGDMRDIYEKEFKKQDKN